MKEGSVSFKESELGSYFQFYISMLVAEFVEKERRDAVNLNPHAHMSVMWLSPQLILMGFLAIVHTVSQDRDIETMAVSLTGYFNAGRLDYFYYLIAGIGVLNFFYFLYCAHYKGRIQYLEKKPYPIHQDDLELDQIKP
ncbi:hypothetical protein QYF36_024141 [Acer negundo]|nr:hypothetical protein QYF36_024141 [Acer negundo]